MHIQRAMIGILLAGLLASTAACSHGATSDTQNSAVPQQVPTPQDNPPATCLADSDCVSGETCNAGSCENKIAEKIMEVSQTPIADQMGPTLTDTDHNGKTDQLEPQAIQHVLTDPPPFPVPATLDNLTGNWKCESYVVKDKGTGKKTDWIKSGHQYEVIISNASTITDTWTDPQGNVSTNNKDMPLTVKDGSFLLDNLPIEASIVKGNVMYWSSSQNGFRLDAMLIKE